MRNNEIICDVQEKTCYCKFKPVLEKQLLDIIAVKMEIILENNTLVDKYLHVSEYNYIFSHLDINEKCFNNEMLHIYNIYSYIQYTLSDSINCGKIDTSW